MTKSILKYLESRDLSTKPTKEWQKPSLLLSFTGNRRNPPVLAVITRSTTCYSM